MYPVNEAALHTNIDMNEERRPKALYNLPTSYPKHKSLNKASASLSHPPKDVKNMIKR